MSKIVTLLSLLSLLACGSKSDTSNAHIVDCSLSKTCKGAVVEVPTDPTVTEPSRNPNCKSCSVHKPKVFRIIDPCGDCKGTRDEVIFQLSNFKYASYKLVKRKVITKKRVCKVKRSKLCKRKYKDKTKRLRCCTRKCR